MKKIYLALVLVLCVFQLKAQSPRTIMVEEFTQASCGPCAAQNPTFNALLDANSSKLISIKYQTSWPGVDPMNAQTQTWVGPRVTYYGVSGVPTATLDGTQMTGSSYAGAPANWSQAKIDARSTVLSPFEMNITHTYSPNEDSIYISCTVTCTQAVTGNFALHVGIVEKTISFAAAPGTNGEKEFYSVMRKMVPSATGTSLGTSWTVGQSQTFNFAEKVPTYIYDRNEMAMVSFIQDNTTFTATASNASGATTLVLNGANPGVIAGSYVSGNGIATGTIVTAVSGSNLTLSDATTAANSGATFTFANKKVQQAAYDQPLPLSKDASLKQSASIDPVYACATTVSPSFELTNTGLTTLTTCDINYTVGATSGTYTWNGSLATGQTTTVTIPNLAVSSGSNTFNGQIASINGLSDNNSGNNTVSMVYNIPATTAGLPPVTADFVTAIPATWMIGNYGSANTWLRSIYPSSPVAQRGSVKFPFHDANSGEADYLYLPVVDLSSANAPSMTFMLSKAPFGAPYLDRLDVVVSTDCGQTWTSQWSKTDPALGTVAQNSTSYYSPSAVYSAAQWRKETVDLTPYIGQSQVHIAFKAIAGKGNNGYIDDVNLSTAVGIGENSTEQTISLFPTPTSKDLFIDLSAIKSQTVSVSIADASGRILHNEIAVKVDNMVHVDLSVYENGTYFVSVDADGQRITKTAILSK